MRFAEALCLCIMLAEALHSACAENLDEARSWLATAQIMRSGGSSYGAGVYLEAGLVITAAHVVDPTSVLSVNINGRNLPAKIRKLGSLEGVDLGLLSVEPEKLPAGLPRMPLCQHAPWPGDPVIVVDATTVSHSHIASPYILNMFSRNKFGSLISDVDSTGNSGSGVFDFQRKCLLGIISRKFFAVSPQGEKGIAKYFVPAHEIRDFLTAALKDAK